VLPLNSFVFCFPDFRFSDLVLRISNFIYRINGATCSTNRRIDALARASVNPPRYDNGNSSSAAPKRVVFVLCVIAAPITVGAENIPAKA
jgi:hypothetical protein